MFEGFSPYFIKSPGGVCQFTLCCSIAFNQVFNRTKDKLHEDGLRAYPSAEYPAEYHGKQNDKYQGRDKHQQDQMEILRPEDHSENDKLAFENIEQK